MESLLQMLELLKEFIGEHGDKDEDPVVCLSRLLEELRIFRGIREMRNKEALEHAGGDHVTAH